ncbi:hypothetical protein [Aeromonas sobria]|uniref:Putative mob-associated protein n=2 Tax=Aeromonas sobria TaxID=646 RepID=A0A2H5BSF0_AERSO|nr:hypothetical protein [Aeromonas sobria]AUG89277.1 putative mob-associated protein [Aeromonas sobria]
MSKIETVKALDNSQPQLALISAVQRLEQTVQQLRQELGALPPTLADEVVRVLEPLQDLLALPDQVRAMSTLQKDLISVLVSQGTEELREQVGGIGRALNQARTDLGGITGLPVRLKAAVDELTPLLEGLRAPPPPVRPLIPWWPALLAAVLTGMIMTAGMLAWQRHESVELKRLTTFDKIWAQATPQEREQMRGILQR